MKRSQKTPAEESSAKKTLPGASSGKTSSEHHYRCPACGALVDSHDREQTARHHRHVLFPNRFDLRRSTAKDESSPLGQIKR